MIYREDDNSKPRGHRHNNINNNYINNDFNNVIDYGNVNTFSNNGYNNYNEPEPNSVSFDSDEFNRTNSFDNIKFDKANFVNKSFEDEPYQPTDKGSAYFSADNLLPNNTNIRPSFTDCDDDIEHDFDDDDLSDDFDDNDIDDIDNDSSSTMLSITPSLATISALPDTDSKKDYHDSIEYRIEQYRSDNFELQDSIKEQNPLDGHMVILPPISSDVDTPFVSIKENTVESISFIKNFFNKLKHVKSNTYALDRRSFSLKKLVVPSALVVLLVIFLCVMFFDDSSDNTNAAKNNSDDNYTTDVVSNDTNIKEDNKDDKDNDDTNVVTQSSTPSPSAIADTTNSPSNSTATAVASISTSSPTKKASTSAPAKKTTAPTTKPVTTQTPVNTVTPAPATIAPVTDVPVIPPVTEEPAVTATPDTTNKLVATIESVKAQSGKYTFKITLTNNTGNDILSWSGDIAIEPHSNITSASISERRFSCSGSNGRYTITPSLFNSSIYNGSSKSFNITFSSDSEITAGNLTFSASYSTESPWYW